MKNIWILILCLASTAESLAQGYVNFANTVVSRVSNGGVLQPAATITHCWLRLRRKTPLIPPRLQAGPSSLMEQIQGRPDG